MLQDQLSKNLKEGERLLRLIRRDVLAQLGPALLAALIVLLDFFLIAFFFAHRPWGVLLFFILLLVGVVLAIRVVLEWQLNALLVTDERIICVRQRGLFSRSVSEAVHANVTDVRFAVKGVLPTMLGLGSLEVQTAGEGENLRLDGVRRPAELQAMITTALRTSRHGGVPLSAQELVSALGRLKEEMGDDAFTKAIAKVKPPDEKTR